MWSVCGFHSQRQAGNLGFSSNSTLDSNPCQKTFIQPQTSACILPTLIIYTHTHAPSLLPTCVKPRNTDTLKSTSTSAWDGYHNRKTCSHAPQMFHAYPHSRPQRHTEKQQKLLYLHAPPAKTSTTTPTYLLLLISHAKKPIRRTLGKPRKPYLSFLPPTSCQRVPWGEC